MDGGVVFSCIFRLGCLEILDMEFRGVGGWCGGVRNAHLAFCITNIMYIVSYKVNPFSALSVPKNACVLLFNRKAEIFSYPDRLNPASHARHPDETERFWHTVLVLSNCISRHLGAALARRIRSTDVSVGQREEEDALDWMRQEVMPARSGSQGRVHDGWRDPLMRVGRSSRRRIEKGC